MVQILLNLPQQDSILLGCGMKKLHWSIRSTGAILGWDVSLALKRPSSLRKIMRKTLDTLLSISIGPRTRVPQDNFWVERALGLS